MEELLEEALISMFENILIPDSEFQIRRIIEPIL